MQALRPDQLAALSRLFSPGVIREMARKGKSRLFARLAIEASLPERLGASEQVHKLFDLAFSLLKREGCRAEYVYKAAITHNILLGTHSLHTAAMLNEFRVGSCKADIVILNGTATVYEVKSERDSLTRLERQVDAYLQVFARVYVISAESHVASVLESVPEDVGIMVLNKRQHITKVREADDRAERTSAAAIFDAIRTNEARLILQSKGIAIPDVPNTEISSALRTLFAKLDPRDAQQGMVDVLKRTRNLLPLTSLIDQLPSSLHTAALSISLRKADHTRLVDAVNTCVGEAMAWA